MEMQQGSTQTNFGLAKLPKVVWLCLLLGGPIMVTKNGAWTD